jgi:hypothetical protein
LRLGNLDLIYERCSAATGAERGSGPGEIHSMLHRTDTGKSKLCCPRSSLSPFRSSPSSRSRPSSPSHTLSLTHSVLDNTPPEPRTKPGRANLTRGSDLSTRSIPPITARNTYKLHGAKTLTGAWLATICTTFLSWPLGTQQMDDGLWTITTRIRFWKISQPWVYDTGIPCGTSGIPLPRPGLRKLPVATNNLVLKTGWGRQHLPSRRSYHDIRRFQFGIIQRWTSKCCPEVNVN